MTSDSLAAVSAATGKPSIEVNGDFVRGQSATRTFTVDGPQLAAYAAATGDTRADRLAGETSSPAYGFVPVTQMLFDLVENVAGEALGPTGLVHTHQEFLVHEPIGPGDELTLTMHASNIEGGPFGAVITVLATTTRGDGTLLNTQYITGLLVGASVVNPILDTERVVVEPPVIGKPPKGTANLAIARDQTQRYADASGDRNPMHLDPAFARANGFPGVIVHGMSTLALAANAIEAKHPELTRASRMAVEFARPVFPGDRLTVRWDEVEADGGVDVTFEVLNRKQRTVMRGGGLSLRP